MTGVFGLGLIGPSEVRATSRANLGMPLFLVIGPSEVRATSEANLGRPLFLLDIQPQTAHVTTVVYHHCYLLVVYHHCYLCCANFSEGIEYNSIPLH